MGKYTSKKPDANGDIHYTPEENKTWEILIKRQMNTIIDRGCYEYADGIEKLDLPINRIPQLKEVNTKLTCTGWQVVPVDVIIPLSQFFNLLASKKFPVATFIRAREELDYLQEPDLFHEIFGHCALLCHQPYADLMQSFGKCAQTLDKKFHYLLGRVFWFTIEFGLIQTTQGLRVMGAGILSSHEETICCLESAEPLRKPFNLNEVIATDYRYDQIQKLYYVIDSWDALYKLANTELLKQAIIHHKSSNGGSHTNFITC